MHDDLPEWFISVQTFIAVVTCTVLDYTYTSGTVQQRKFGQCWMDAYRPIMPMGVKWNRFIVCMAWSTYEGQTQLVTLCDLMTMTVSSSATPTHWPMCRSTLTQRLRRSVFAPQLCRTWMSSKLPRRDSYTLAKRCWTCLRITPLST